MTATVNRPAQLTGRIVRRGDADFPVAPRVFGMASDARRVLPADASATPDPLTGDCLAWIAEFDDALASYASGAYLNVPNAGMTDWESAYWGANVDRLRTIKATYDPDDVFSYEQSSPPVAAH